jgi:ectoine hydroxylase-related dioxygenase (phytanoyl-CoA dioxygenase family)
MQTIMANDVTLTEEQVHRYEEEGFLVVPDVFDAGHCDAIKEEALRYAEEDYRVCLNIHREVPLFMNIARDPVLVRIVKAVQKSPIVVINDQLAFKKGGTPYARQAWTPHQDNAYVKAPYGTYMQLHLFLDDWDRENGCMYYYCGSHQEDLLPYKYVRSTHESQDADGISRPGWTVTPPPQYKTVDIVASKGAICLQHGNVIHGSYPNLTHDRDRSQYTIAYLNKGASFQEGKSSKKIPIEVE